MADQTLGDFDLDEENDLNEEEIENEELDTEDSDEEGSEEEEGEEWEPDSNEEEEKKPKSKKNEAWKQKQEARQRAIDRRIWEANEAERRAIAAAERAEAASQKLEDAAAAAGNPKPKLEDYESQEEYIEDITTWKANHAISEHVKKSRETNTNNNSTQVKLPDGYVERHKAGAQKYTDYVDNEKLVAGIISANKNERMGRVLMESPYMVEVVRHLAKNPEEAERIARLSSDHMGIEMSDLIKEVKSKKAPKKKQSSTPPPPQRHKGSGGGTFKNASDMTYEEFEKARNEGKL